MSKQQSSQAQNPGGKYSSIVYAIRNVAINNVL
jgi:hypothetical protein